MAKELGLAWPWAGRKGALHLAPARTHSLPRASAECPFSLAQGQKLGELQCLTEAGFEPRSGCPKASVQLGCSEGAGDTPSILC